MTVRGNDTIVEISRAHLNSANVIKMREILYRQYLDTCNEQISIAVGLINLLRERRDICEADVGTLTLINVKQGMQITELQAHNKKLDKKNKWLQIKALLFLIAGSSLVLLN